MHEKSTSLVIKTFFLYVHVSTPCSRIYSRPKDPPNFPSPVPAASSDHRAKRITWLRWRNSYRVAVILPHLQLLISAFSPTSQAPFSLDKQAEAGEAETRRLLRRHRRHLNSRQRVAAAEEAAAATASPTAKDPNPTSLPKTQVDFLRKRENHLHYFRFTLSLSLSTWTLGRWRRNQFIHHHIQLVLLLDTHSTLRRRHKTRRLLDDVIIVVGRRRRNVQLRKPHSSPLRVNATVGLRRDGRRRRTTSIHVRFGVRRRSLLGVNR